MGDNDPDMHLVYQNFGRRKRILSQKTIEQRLAKEKEKATYHAEAEHN